MKRSTPTAAGTLAASLVLSLGGCGAPDVDGARPGVPEAHEHRRATASGAPNAQAARPGTVQATLVASPRTPLAGERAQLTFTLTDGSGRPVEQLIPHHARKFHVIIVSKDMQVFEHVHPWDFGEPIEHGKAKVYCEFPQPGRYVVAADFMTHQGPHAAQFIIEVAAPVSTVDRAVGAAAAPSVRVVEVEEDDRHTAPVLLGGPQRADGYAVSLQKPDKVRAGEPVSLGYRFARNGAPVTDLRLYLAAPMHLAVVKDDLTQFLHEHGTIPGDEHAAHQGHASHGGAGRATFGPEVAATVTFPEAGTYYLFGQAAHGDRLLISRFAVEVD